MFCHFAPLLIQSIVHFFFKTGNIFRVRRREPEGGAVPKQHGGSRARTQRNIADAFVPFRLRSHDASIPVKRLNIKVGLLCRQSGTACERPRHEVH